MSASEPSVDEGLPQTSAKLADGSEEPKIGRNGKPVRPLIANLQERRARQKQRNPIVRGVYLLVALTILLLGIVMLITPGPAFVLIPIGLTLLALEFASAERLLDRALDQADAAKEKAANTTKSQRILGIIASVLGVAAAVAATIYWDLTQYLPF